MKSRLLPLLEGFFRYTLFIIAAFFLLAYIVVAIIRINYPFELEWIEEGMVVHVARLLQGLPIYTQPSVEFVPFVYPPLFYYASALVAMVTGIGYAPLRLVSFLSSLGIMLFLFLFVKKETKDTASSFLATCLFAACYSASLFWFDLGRVDSLALLFLMGSLYLIRFHTTFLSTVVSGILITLAFLTKQGGLTLILPVVMYLFFVNWKKALVLSISLICSLVGANIILDSIYHGLYSHFVLFLPFNILNDLFLPSRLITIWAKDLLKPVPIIILLLIYYILFGKKEAGDKSYAFYLFAAASMILGSLPFRSISYGNSNALMPAFLILALIGALSFNLIKMQLNQMDTGKSSKLKILLFFALIAQFFVLMYKPSEVIPTKGQEVREEALLAEITEFDGEVFMPSHGFIATLVDKPTSAHISGVSDVLFSDPVYGKKLYDELLDSFREKRYSAIFLDQYYFEPEIQAELEKYYEKEKTTEGIAKILNIYNLEFLRQTYIYVPRK